jgi:hypothetical protein
MIPGSREKRGGGAAKLAGQPVPEVTLVVPRPRERRAGTQLYLERATLVEMTERPLLVMSRPLPADQTQIVRRPVRRPSGRRWIFIFGGAATATLLAAWLGFGQHAPTSQAAALVAPAATIAPTRANTATTRPIVAPLAAPPPVSGTSSAAVFAATSSSRATPPLASRRSPRAVSASLASGRHTAPSRIASSSRLAAHRAPASIARPAATIAWVDPFIDR